ncbi:LysE family translocator [Fulvivirgaceae bacterium PWU4]|uniref:LysE family translocator n=1 Tax=Chryseosolibacter histidini TaxID=2782349 RepID=A0AAP2DRM7_9BACT|nr:LysE family transporter [Chryseosolibacter histidini]MBT1701225.1 LysE family translocator [Chryseosolibacter histidini]
MESVLKGIASGIVLAFLIGPVFFTILQTSIERGFWSGFFVAIGVSLSDAFYISVCYLGVYQFFDQGNFKEYLAYFGGGVLLVMGFYYLVIKSRKLAHYDPQNVQAKSPYKLIVKGFIINGLTPMVLVFWLGTVGVATTKLGYVTPGKAIPFFVAIVCTVFLTDVIKAKLADKLRQALTPRFIRTMNLVLGLVMLIFGGRLIFMADNFHVL